MIVTSFHQVQGAVLSILRVNSLSSHNGPLCSLHYGFHGTGERWKNREGSKVMCSRLDKLESESRPPSPQGLTWSGNRGGPQGWMGRVGFVQHQLHNVQGPVQSENVGPCSKIRTNFKLAGH